MQTRKLKNIMLLGGGRISYYVARQMLDFGASVKIVEQDLEVCEVLKEKLPGAVIIHGNASDEKLLLAEGISDMDAVCSLTGVDEENVLLSLYSQSVSKAKTITKVNRMSFNHIIKSMDLNTIVHPRYVAADRIVRYARAMENSKGSNVETLYKIVGNQAEALEFRVRENSALCGVPLMELHIRKNILIGAIVRQEKVITPGGKDIIEPGDTIIVVTGITGLNNLDDILEKTK